MKELHIFENSEFGKVRTVTIDNKPYFVAKDIAKSLGYTETAKAIRTHCKGVSEMDIPTNGGIQKAKVIPEGDVYRLIVRSKLPSAEKFESWVFDEVLPSIRKTGSYQLKPLSTLEQIQLLAQGNVELEKKVDAVDKDLQEFKQDMPILGVEEGKITSAVRRKGVECLGGKDSEAYKDNSIRGKVYADIYGQLKREFGVDTYKAIKRSQCDEAVKTINSYQLPYVLQETINDCNAQVHLY